MNSISNTYFLLSLISGVAPKNTPMFAFDQVFVLDENEEFAQIDFETLQEAFETEREISAESFRLYQEGGFTSLKVQVPIFIGLVVLLIVLAMFYKKNSSAQTVINTTTDSTIVTISEIVTTDSSENLYNHLDEGHVTRREEPVYDNIGYNNSAENLLVINTADFVGRSTNYAVRPMIMTDV